MRRRRSFCPGASTRSSASSPPPSSHATKEFGQRFRISRLGPVTDIKGHPCHGVLFCRNLYGILA
eukprot:3676583-Rhodomonas_salina.1